MAENQSRVVRTLIVEDQGMFRGFLERWLAEQSGYALTGSARSGEDALAMMESARPDVIIADLNLPNMDGLEFVRAARQVRPEARALILSSLVDPLALTRVRESGVEGYVEKDAPPETLAEALAAVASGHRYYSARFTEALAREVSRPGSVGKILTRREQEVLAHVVAGRTSREIGDAIGLSVRTVEFHRGNLMAKLGATNATELVARARLHGFG